MLSEEYLWCYVEGLKKNLCNNSLKSCCMYILSVIILISFFLSSDRKIFLLVGLFFFFLHDKGLKLLRVYLCVQHGEELGRFSSTDTTAWKSLGCV